MEISEQKAIDRDKRAEAHGRYLLDNRTTIRKTAEAFKISKSTVHNDIHQRLEPINPKLYQFIRELLCMNRMDAPRRGGIAKHEKWAKRKTE